MTPELLAMLLDSILFNRLVIWVGAGLSVSGSSSVPSAAALASQAVARYRTRSSAALPADAATNLESLTRHFHSRRELASTFLAYLVDSGPFMRPPNAGHFALADFLGCGAVEAAITTNIDFLVEAAALELGEPQLEAALDSDEATRPHEHHPFLKLHGCGQRDKVNTIWCADQLADEPIKSRALGFRAWLAANLKNKDLVFVGFWSDWAYLKEPLDACLSVAEARSVTLVSPDSALMLEEKAPALWKWAQGSGRFHHEQVDGGTFLDELRKHFGLEFRRQLLLRGQGAAASLFGVPASVGEDAAALSSLTSKELFALRRDACGVSEREMPRVKSVSDQMELLGALHLRLLASGARLREPNTRSAQSDFG